MAKLLVVEDEANLRLAIQRTLARAGHVVQEASDVAGARLLLAEREYDMVVTDVLLGDGRPTGLELVRELRGRGFDGVIVVMTAYTSVDNAVAAMKDGADDYLQKPLSLEELSMQTTKWLEHRRLSRRLELYERMDRSRDAANGMLGESGAWKRVVGLADRLAASWSVASDDGEDDRGLPGVLIVGETGVGKSVLARYIHERACGEAQPTTAIGGSHRCHARRAPFVHVHCSALPAASLEGELFGVERGEAPGGTGTSGHIPEQRSGLLEMADGGTIFLDEVGDLPVELQSKLLEAVESGEFRRVGGSRLRRVHVRVIASSNRDLDELVEAGEFRRDLLYRLNALTIRVPPLRERGGDAELIAGSVLGGSRRGAGMRFSAEAVGAFERFTWPGNIRELVNAVQRAILLCDDGVIEPHHLGLDETRGDGLLVNAGVRAGVGGARTKQASALNAGGAGVSGGEREAGANGELNFDFHSGVHTFEDVERTLIMQALQHTGGNVSGAAKLIGMQRSSLRYRIDRYNLESYVAEVTKR